MDKKRLNVDDMANAKYVMLSLLRELDNLRNKDKNNEKYQREIQQLEYDLKYYDNKTLLNKVNQVYLPYLQSLLEENYD